MSVNKWLAVGAGRDTVKLLPMEGAGPDFFVKLADFERLERAIKWALGEEGNFGEPHTDEKRPPFWWRTELRERAGLRWDREQGKSDYSPLQERALCKHGKGPLCPECAAPQEGV